MRNKKLIVTPPSNFKNSDSYLDYLAKLIVDKPISIQLIKSIPLVINNPESISILGSGLSSPQGFIQKKLLDMNEDHLKSISNYFQERALVSEYVMGFDKPTELREQELQLSDCLMWAIEISSDYNLWNELFGTRETELAKEVNLPSLCLPCGITYSKPEQLLIICKDDTDIESYIPVDIIEYFDLRVTLMIDSEDAVLDVVSKKVQSLNLDNRLQLIKAGFLDGQDILKSYVNSANPSWIAYHNFDKSFIDRAFNMNTNNFILSAERPILIL